MTLSINLLDSQVGTSDTTTIVSGNVSPAGGALVVIIIGYARSSDQTIDSVVSTFSIEGSWVEQIQDVVYDGTFYIRAAIYTAIASETPGVGTITVTFSAVSRVKTLVTMEALGQHQTAPIVQTKSASESGSDTTLTITLDSTPQESSLVIGGIVQRQDGSDSTILPGTNFTELIERQTGSATNKIATQAQYDLGSATSIVDWSGLASGSTNGSIGVSIEIAEGSEGSGEIFEEAVPLNKNLDILFDSLMIFEDSVGLGKELYVLFDSLMIFEDSVELDKDLDVLFDSQMIFEDSVELDKDLDILFDSQMEFDVGLLLDKENDILIYNNITKEMSLSLSKISGFPIQDQIDFYLVLNLQKENDIFIVSDLIVEETLNLLKTLITSYSVEEIIRQGSIVFLADESVYLVSLENGAIYLVKLSNEEVNKVLTTNNPI